MSDPLLEVTGLSISFGSGRRRTLAVDDLSYRLGRGETLAIVGESGSGKSVSSMALIGLLPQRQARIESGAAWFDGRDLLAGPMTVRYLTADGEGTWRRTDVGLAEHGPSRAVFTGLADAEAVTIETTSTVDFDGCMRVEATLRPGAKPRQLERLWIEIPMREAEVPLFHQVNDGVRYHYSGSVPAGNGVVWDSTHAGTWGGCAGAARGSTTIWPAANAAAGTSF